MKTLTLVLGLGWVLMFGAEATSFPGGPTVGEMAPAIKITQWIQAPTNAAAVWPNGKVVVLEFWATWCGPCVGAIPHLNELADEFKEQPVEFISLTDEGEKTIKKFLTTTALHAWVGLTPDFFGEDKPYRVEGIPHAVVIDRQGRIAAVIDPRNLTADMIRKCLLAEPLPQPNEPGGEKVPGVVPGQYRISGAPLFQVLIRPAQRTNQVETWSDDAVTFQPARLASAILDVFGIDRGRMIAETPLPEGFYDFYISLPPIKGEGQGKEMLREVFAQAVRASFGLSVKKETREVEVYLLRTNATSMMKLTPSAGGERSLYSGWNEIRGQRARMNEFAKGLEHAVEKPVLDETGLTNEYDYRVTWDQQWHQPNPEGMIAAVKKFGLELTLEKRALEVVVASDAQSTTNAASR